MAHFGNTVEISSLQTLAAALQAAGYTGMNNLSLLQIGVNEPAGSEPATQLKVFLTQDGIHPPVTPQIHTATLVGTVTVAGNVIWTISAAALPFGLDHEVEVAVEVGDNAAAVARKSAYTLSRDAILAEVFRSIEASGDTVVFTAWPTVEGNDATMNAAYAEGTSDGLTADSTSTQSQAGDTTPDTSGILIASGASNNLIAGNNTPGQFVDAGLVWLYPEFETSGSGDPSVFAQIVAVGGGV